MNYTDRLDVDRIEKELPLGRIILSTLWDAQTGRWPNQNWEQRAEAMFNELVRLGYAK